MSRRNTEIMLSTVIDVIADNLSPRRIRGRARIITLISPINPTSRASIKEKNASTEGPAEMEVEHINDVCCGAFFSYGSSLFLLQPAEIDVIQSEISVF